MDAASPARDGHAHPPPPTRLYGDALRFGIHSGQLHGSYEICRDLWRRAEQLGYDWISLIDHLRPHLYGPDQPCFEGMTLLAALAAQTERIRCAMLVTGAMWRHPAVTAAAMATIDHVCDGRLEVGLGAGGPDLAYEQYGIPFPAAGERLDRLDETCEILRRLWTEPETTFEGRHFRLDRARLAPKPRQAHVPLVVGGSGVRRTLRTAARHADIWNTLATTTEDYGRQLAALRGHCVDVGRDEAGIRRSVTFRAVLVERASGVDARSAELLRGAPDEVRAEYLSLGTPEQCVADLRPYVDLGVRDFLLAVKPPIDWQTVELMITRVAPALREYASSREVRG
ncbi:LLM class flavin-dependent oxidoreductase [Micromonospora rubida]|uniref:LLM class flavin-dependent oxidoreductase n=1 Tax=Micromonospora rubida TaxID=2697657 RepID=UPI001377148D|nr:LLM class flavin-dependent oxidoreductase [Micromonospora rubida]NBE83262.1 LLM class flavin-dependent oxidoreductase [Micromonospora rubida]